jgi:predicted DNA-binding protein (UPF0251 family)
MSALTEVVLTFDELEAIRLGDLEGYYQEDAAVEMGVSRQTFGRIIEAAHRKVAEALCHGKALQIEGGIVEMMEIRKFTCSGCGHNWEVPYGVSRPSACPECKSVAVHRSLEDRGHGGGCGRGGGRRRGWRKSGISEREG